MSGWSATNSCLTSDKSHTNTTFLSEWDARNDRTGLSAGGQSNAGPGMLGMVGPDLTQRQDLSHVF